MPRVGRRVFLRLSALFAPAVRLRAIVLAPPAPAAPLSADGFLRLSRRLLDRATLDAAVGATYRDALLATPGTAATLVSLASAVEAGAERTAEQKALEATIVEWWYTGAYVSGGERGVATHTGALMWSALGMPAPGSCAGPFGAWGRPPKAAKG